MRILYFKGQENIEFRSDRSGIKLQGIYSNIIYLNTKKLHYVVRT